MADETEEINDESPTEDEDGDDGRDNADTLTERVERFKANNSGVSAIEVVAQLDIDPDQKNRVEEVLA